MKELVTKGLSPQAINLLQDQDSGGLMAIEWINRIVAATGNPPKGAGGTIKGESYGKGPYVKWLSLKTARPEELADMELSDAAIRLLNK